MIIKPTVVDYFHYSPETGLLTWAKQPSRSVKVGSPAGRLHKYKNCMIVTLHGKQYKVHRVIWCMIYGEPIPDIIDHIDRDATNNRLNNLRAATNSLNCLNTNQGVTFRRGRWRMRFQDLEETYATKVEAMTRRNQLMREHGVIA